MSVAANATKQPVFLLKLKPFIALTPSRSTSKFTALGIIVNNNATNTYPIPPVVAFLAIIETTISKTKLM